MSFPVIVALFLNLIVLQSVASEPKKVLDVVRERLAKMDAVVMSEDFQFIQHIEFVSVKGDRDDLVFKVTARHGLFNRELISTTIPNDNRFRDVYKVFEKSFMMSEYFPSSDNLLTSCTIEKGIGEKDYRLKFGYGSPTEPSRELTSVYAIINSSTNLPEQINEEMRGLPLDVELHNEIKVGYSPELKACYPKKIVMRFYSSILFLKGELAVFTIRNDEPRRL